MPERTDLLIVNPNARIPAPFAAIEPPLWAGLCASWWGADLMDAEAEGWTVEQTAQAIRLSGHKNVIIVVMGNNPSVSSTPKMPVAEALADAISDLHVSLTGLHPIAAGSKYPVIKQPFKGMPMMPWRKLKLDKYRAHNWHCLDDVDKRSPYASIYTSLGCPFSCSYCNIHALYGGERIVQFRPIKDVLTEVETLVTLGVRNIKIWDELFSLKEDRVIEICQGLKLYDLNLWAYARLDTVTTKMLKAMKAAGVNWLAYGLESIADRKVIPYVDVVIKMTRGAGINIIANFMFGLPGETEDDRKTSLDFAVRQNFEYVNFYVALPYPGSQWWADLKDKPTDWSRFSQYAPNMYGDPKVIKFKDEAFQMYFRRPEYLSMIARKFGPKAEAHIKEMVAWNIRG